MYPEASKCDIQMAGWLLTDEFGKVIELYANEVTPFSEVLKVQNKLLTKYQVRTQIDAINLTTFKEVNSEYYDDQNPDNQYQFNVEYQELVRKVR